MTLNPDVQHNAQDEIDRVIGPGILPTIAYRVRLPYVNAVVKEVFRWHPVVPMGIPHMLTAATCTMGIIFPKVLYLCRIFGKL